MSQAAINRSARRATRARVLGPEAECARCGWREVTALTKTRNGVLCYECQSIKKGRATMERHHILGKANDPSTVPVPGNLHRQLSDRQLDWSKDLKSNPDRDPLIWLAQACQGMSDHIAWWATILARLAAWLVELAAVLRREHGGTWWEHLGMPALGEVTAP